MYFIYTDQNDLVIDLNFWSMELSPFYHVLEQCFVFKGSLTPLGIALIVIVCVLSLITTALILYWLRKQLGQLWAIGKNRFNHRMGKIPENTIDSEPPKMDTR